MNIKNVKKMNENIMNISNNWIQDGYPKISGNLCTATYEVTEMFEIYSDTEKSDRIRKRKYRCSLCSYSSMIEEDLQTHLREHADKASTSTDKSVICDVCKVTLSSEIRLMIHMKTHYDGAYYYCDICNVRMRRLSQLIIHRRFHTEEDPNRCPYCYYRSKRTDNLQRHVKLFHEMQGFFYDSFNPREMLIVPTFNEIPANSQSPFSTPATSSFSTLDTTNDLTLL